METFSSAGNGKYRLVDENGNSREIYCFMSTIPSCPGRGWALVMRINHGAVSLEMFLWPNGFESVM